MHGTLAIVRKPARGALLLDVLQHALVVPCTSSKCFLHLCARICIAKTVKLRDLRLTQTACLQTLRYLRCSSLPSLILGLGEQSAHINVRQSHCASLESHAAPQCPSAKHLMHSDAGRDDMST